MKSAAQIRSLVLLLALATVGCHERTPESAEQHHSDHESPQPSSVESGFLCVMIPEAIEPTDRGVKYSNPLHEALREGGLGEVSGGGSMLAADGEVEYVNVDVEVTDVRSALPVIRATLRKAGAPVGTVIEEHRDDGVLEHPVW